MDIQATKSVQPNQYIKKVVTEKSLFLRDFPFISKEN